MDTVLSDFSGLKVHRTHKADRTVPALPVVVQFNVLINLMTDAFARRKMLAVYGFNLQAMEESLGTGVVVAVAFGIHAARQIML